MQLANRTIRGRRHLIYGSLRATTGSKSLPNAPNYAWRKELIVVNDLAPALKTHNIMRIYSRPFPDISFYSALLIKAPPSHTRPVTAHFATLEDGSF